MSVIKSEFKVDGVESEVIFVSYSFDQNVDNIGQPAGEVRGGQIAVTVRSTGNAYLAEWMFNSDMKKSGEIVYTDREGQTLKTLRFEDAYCVGYTEDYEAFNGDKINGLSQKEGAKESLLLSCRTIDIEGNLHENTWV